MDIPRRSNARSKLIRGALALACTLLLIGGASFGLSRLHPAAPSVDKTTVWTDVVRRGAMTLEVTGSGSLVPEDSVWVPAQTDAQVEKILLRPGASVSPNTVIMELNNLTLKKDAVDAEFQLKASEAEYSNLQVQVNSDLLNQKAIEASVRSDYEQAKIQHEVDEKLLKEGIGSSVMAKLSAVKEEQLAVRLQLEGERTTNVANAAKARLQVQSSHVEQQRALYQLREAELNALHVRAGITGVLQLLPVEEGQHVTPGTNLARVTDPTKLKAEIKVAETQARDLSVGLKAIIDTRNGIVEGRVTRIDPSVQNGTVTVDIAITGTLPNGARPDLSIDGTIEIEKLKDVLYVGRPVHGAAYSTISLFKLSPDGTTARRVNVKIGRSSVNTVEIMDGVQVGDRVILSDTSSWDNDERVLLK